MESEEKKKVAPVDEMLPTGRLFAFGLQHVLAMYAGAVAVPIILAQALRLSPEQLIKLINADLFASGIATLIQTLGVGFFGAKIPMIQGVTFAAVSPMVIIGTDFGLQGIYGATIVAGIVTVLLSKVFSKLIRFFPPVVTGSIITIIGITLLPVAVRWAGGGNMEAAEFGSLPNLTMAALTLLIVLVVYRYGKGVWKNVSVLLGLVAGTIIAYFAGFVNFEAVETARWFDVVLPFYFGYPTFHLMPIISMIIVMLVVMVETTGDCIAIGEIVEKKVDSNVLARCLSADGASTILGGLFNSFPHSAFAQNVGLVAVTGVKSRFVVAMSGVILIVLGLFPKMAAVIACIPNAVLGGAGIAMFGMTIASGIRALAKVEFDGTYNLMIVAVSIGTGMITLAVPDFYRNFPEWAQLILHSGITFGSFVAVCLNIFLNGAPKSAEVVGSDHSTNLAFQKIE